MSSDRRAPARAHGGRVAGGRVALASFAYEGNSFALRRDGHDDFARSLLVDGQAVIERSAGRQTALGGALAVLARAGLTPVPLLAAKGVSGGGVVESFYQDTCRRLLAALRAALPLDGVYLALHGAMICDGRADPEGELLAAVRSIVGPNVPVSASLDLHAHVTPAMVAQADILVGYETYPHLDACTTGERAARLLVDTIDGRIRPVMRLRRIQAILPVLGGATDGDGPMAAVAREAREAEVTGEALSVSYFPVQPWLDFPDVGIAGLAIADGDADAAARVATRIVEGMWQRRRQFDLPLHEAGQAVRLALSMPAPTVLLVDATDSVGGGASGDSPIVLKALLADAAAVDAAISLVDAPAADQAHRAGVGATLTVALGATLDARHHRPVTVTAVVERLGDGRFVYSGGPGKGLPAEMGPSAVLRVGRLRIVVVSFPFYEFADEHYASLGIDIRTMKLVSFKNLMNYRTQLSPEVDHLIIEGPGATPPRLDQAPWQNKPRPFWPCDDSPDPPFMD